MTYLELYNAIDELIPPDQAFTLEVGTRRGAIGVGYVKEEVDETPKVETTWTIWLHDANNHYVAPTPDGVLTILRAVFDAQGVSKRRDDAGAGNMPIVEAPR